MVLAHERPSPVLEAPLDWPLTRQERAVVGRVLLGKSNSDIAGDLFVAETTVERRLSNVYEKLGVRGRSELLASLFQATRLPDLIAAERAEAASEQSASSTRPLSATRP